MSAEEQIVDHVATARVSNKLTLDSEQQQKREQQERQILEQIQRKKQQKRQKKEQAQRLERQKQKKQQEKQKIYQQPEKMFEEDSDDGIDFKRVVKKIKRVFPQLVNKYDHYGQKKKNDFIVDDENDSQDQSEQDSSGLEQSSQNKKQQKKKHSDKKQRKQQKKIQKKVQKKHSQKHQRSERNHNETPVKKQKKEVKIQPKMNNISDRKQRLVKQVSVRWWYALPAWPPKNIDYSAKLKQMGYRIVQASKFKSETDVVDGLQKVVQVEGYEGVFKSKIKLVDARPLQTAPSMNNFRKMPSEQLTNILRKALKVQIEQLNNVKHEQKGEKQLLVKLEKQLLSLK